MTTPMLTTTYIVLPMWRGGDRDRGSEYCAALPLDAAWNTRLQDRFVAFGVLRERDAAITQIAYHDAAPWLLLSYRLDPAQGDDPLFEASELQDGILVPASVLDGQPCMALSGVEMVCDAEGVCWRATPRTRHGAGQAAPPWVTVFPWLETSGVDWGCLLQLATGQTPLPVWEG